MAMIQYITIGTFFVGGGNPVERSDDRPIKYEPA